MGNDMSSRLPGCLKRLAIVFITLLTLGVSIPASAADVNRSALVVGGDRNDPPYEFINTSGLPSGFNVDITRAIADVMGIKVEIRLGDWAEMRTALTNHEIDLLQNVPNSDYRSKLLDFSRTHTIVSHAIFARKGSPAVHSLEDLREKEVIVLRDGLMHANLVRLGFVDNLILSDTRADVLRLLASGRHDYAVIAMSPGIYLAHEYNLTNIVPISKGIATQLNCYAALKGHTELLDIFNEGLAILKKTGKYEQIYSKWRKDLEPEVISWKTVFKYSALVVFPLLLLIGVIMLWSRSLKKQVAQRTASLANALDELKVNQQQLFQAQKMTSLGILVSGVAHEINNPNGLILLNIPLLKKINADSAMILEKYFNEQGDFPLGGPPYSRMRSETSRILGEMQEAAKRIKHIVHDLKDFSRRDDGDDKELFDLNTVVKASVRLVAPSIVAATNKFETHYAKKLPKMCGSPHRIEQVVVNLIINACQALPDLDRGISLVTRHQKSSGTVELLVRDEGSGIEPEHLPYLTDPFFTTKRDSGGTGLGLSVSAGIVKEHSGTLNFETVSGLGTTVCLSFPTAQEKMHK
jgi:polar amino acid transport system substrate-binding protein